MLLPVVYAHLRQKKAWRAKIQQNLNRTCIITILSSLASISQIVIVTLFSSVVHTVVLYPDADAIWVNNVLCFFLLFFECLLVGELQTSLRINIAPFSVRLCRCQVNKKNLA